MSIAGYFGRRGPEWRSKVGGDQLGIEVEGPVLAGEKSLEERLAEDAARAGREDGEFYSAALKSHCRHPEGDVRCHLRLE